MGMAELAFVISVGTAVIAAVLIIAHSVHQAEPVVIPVDQPDIVERVTDPAAPPVRHLDAALLQALTIQKVVATGDGANDRPLVILSNASLALYPGEVVCVSGDAGRGKSTLLDILALQTPATAGQVRLGDMVVSNLDRVDRDDVIARYIHYIPQDNLALLHRTPVENITHDLTRLDRVNLAEAKRRAEAALRLAGVPRRKFHQAVTKSDFSGGQLARVAIAVAFARAKPIVLADEIFSNIDKPNAAMLLAQFRDLARRQQGVVAIISHDPVLWPLFDRQLDVQGNDPSLSDDELSA